MRNFFSRFQLCARAYVRIKEATPQLQTAAVLVWSRVQEFIYFGQKLVYSFRIYTTHTRQETCGTHFDHLRGSASIPPQISCSLQESMIVSYGRAVWDGIKMMLWWANKAIRVVAILLGVLHAKETGISSGRFGFWLACAFSLPYFTLGCQLIQTPQLGGKASHSSAKYSNEYTRRG